MASKFDNADYKYRVAMLGEFGCGKSALVIRTVVDKFLDEYDPYIEDTYPVLTTIDHPESNKPISIYLDVLDAAGRSEFNSTNPSSFHMQGAYGYMLVYSITSKDTFDIIPSIYEKILHYYKNYNDIGITDSSKIPVILVGNKVDLSDQRQVSTQEGEKLVKSGKIGNPKYVQFFETSAKTKHNCEECYTAIAKMIYEMRDGNNIAKGKKKKGKKGKKNCVIL